MSAMSPCQPANFPATRYILGNTEIQQTTKVIVNVLISICIR